MTFQVLVDRNKNTTGIKCNFEHRCTHQKREKGQYGAWKKSFENRLLDIKPELNFPDIVSNLEIKEGDTVYVVWCEWKEGDSFGWAKNGGFEAVAMFKDQQAAAELSKWIVEDYKADTTAFRSFQTSDGQGFYIEEYAPWQGHFEKLTQVHLQTIVLSRELGIDDPMIKVHP